MSPQKPLTDAYVNAYRVLIEHSVRADIFTLAEFERVCRFHYIKAVLEFHQHNQSHAARAAGIHRNTLRRVILEMREAGMELELRRRQPKSAAAVTARKETA